MANQSFKLFFLISLFISFTSLGQENLNTIKGLLKLNEEVTYWDKDSNTIRSIGHFNSTSFSGLGKRVGIWKFYDKNGNIEEITNYYIGKKHGPSNYFYPSGKKKFEAFFFLDVQDSIFKAYYPNGKLAEKGSYAGIPSAFLNDTSNYIDWQLKLDQFINLKIGIWEYFYENGEPFELTEFKSEDSIEYLLKHYNEKGEITIENGNGFIKESYNSGNPKQISYYENGLPDGEYKMWNANGSLRTIGSYLSGLKDGEWTERYFVSDQVYQKTYFKKGKKDGLFTEFIPDGTKVIEGTFKEDVKNGSWEYYFENGAKDMKGSFINGNQNGEWNFWYPNGQLYYKGGFDSGNKTGEWLFYYNDGSLWKIGSYLDNLKENNWISYYENGQKAFEGSYSKGLENNMWTSWYKNGQKKDQGEYSNGLMNNQWEGWYPNKQLIYSGSYSEDLKKGNWKYWTDKGILKDEENYKIVYKEGSERISNRSIKTSNKDGLWKSYDQIQGKLVSEGNYDNGKQDGNWKYYYPGGVIVNREISYKNGKLNGTSKEYSRKGHLKSEVNYKNNKKNGTMKVYSKRGKLILHVIYKNGVKIKDVLKKIDYYYSKPNE